MNGIIKRVVIENFRSIRNLDLNCANVNVLSGVNDSGKSNVLRALNLFFNDKTDFLKPLKFSDDFCKIALASAQKAAKKKQQIKIKVYFKVPESFSSLKSEGEIFVEKVYGRDQSCTLNYSTRDHKKIAQITKLLHKINYFYIPALKGKDVIQFLLGKVGEHELISSEQINKLNEEINKNLETLQKILQASSVQIKTTMGLPVLVRDFWEKLTINTEYDAFNILQQKIKKTEKSKSDLLKTENYQIPFEARGEGIKSKCVPPLLDWIQGKKSSEIYIWGIDEPENSLEFRKAEELAGLYFNEYSKKRQLFLTTHSFAFIFPRAEVMVKSVIFKCYKDELGETKIDNLNEKLLINDHKVELADELGALTIQKEIMENWREKKEELGKLSILLKDLKQESKPTIYCEGKDDQKILEIAWNKLYPNEEIPFKVASCDGAGYLTTFIKNNGLLSHNKKSIALWDCDYEGYNQLKGLFTCNGFRKIDSSKVSRDNLIFGLVLPTPVNRTAYTNVLCEDPQYQFLSIEHYFSDDLLKKNKIAGEEIEGRIKIINKKNFVEKIIPHLEPTDFKNFKIIFNELKAILN